MSVRQRLQRRARVGLPVLPCLSLHFLKARRFVGLQEKGIKASQMFRPKGIPETWLERRAWRVVWVEEGSTVRVGFERVAEIETGLLRLLWVAMCHGEHC